MKINAANSEIDLMTMTSSTKSSTNTTINNAFGNDRTNNNLFVVDNNSVNDKMVNRYSNINADSTNERQKQQEQQNYQLKQDKLNRLLQQLKKYSLDDESRSASASENDDSLDDEDDENFNPLPLPSSSSTLSSSNVSEKLILSKF